MIDSLIAAISPQWALKRAHARRVLSYYEAARVDRQRKQRREPGSAGRAVQVAGTSIREQARHLEQNHDLARSVLRVLVHNTIGAHGIAVEPTPLGTDGQVDEDLAAQLLAIWEEWGERPDVTRQHTWPAIQRMLARTAYRDGESFCRLLTTPVANHATDIPLSIELLEPDFFPIGYDAENDGRRILDSVELNGWGRPVAYWAYRGHPGELQLRVANQLEMRRLSAADVLHYAMRDRLHQRRGMSLFASILLRFDDLKDYESSESIAAKVAANMGAAIVKGRPDEYAMAADENGDLEPRELKFAPGAIFDNLMPGESIEMIGNNGRPNAQMVNFRNALLKAATAGVGASYSTVSREYDGSYSARRQELVDSWIDYGVLSQDIAAAIVRPIYRRVIAAAVSVGRLTIPVGMDMRQMVQAMYVTPQMPWISPKDEANAWLTLERAGLASGPEIVRKRGRSPNDVRREETLWRKSWKDDGELIDTDPATDVGEMNSAPQIDEDAA